MRKFRLKKKYPGSPELGETRTGSEENCKCYPTEKCMENNPEFWEEIKEVKKPFEKDYEILVKEYQPGFSWHGNGNPNRFKITKVKRLSDGEIFTIGDNTKQGKIKEFKVKYYRPYIPDIEVHFEYNSRTLLCNLEKVKEPLFISEDGIVMYEGDPFWYVCKSLEFTGIFKSTNYANAPNICYFSNEKDAEKYVLENKKSLSLKEVAKVIGECNNTTYVDLDLLTCKLKKIIESEES